MTPGLIRASLENNYAGYAGVRRQVFCEWNTHTLRKKENSTLVETLQPLAGRSFPKHTLPYNGLITHMYYKGLNSMGWRVALCIWSQRRKNGYGSNWVKITELYQLIKNLYRFYFSLRQWKEGNIPCFACELTGWHNFLFRQRFPVCEESAIMISEGFFWTVAQSTAAAPMRSAVQRWHSLPQDLVLAAAKVDVTGTNYQCHIIILKKRSMLARDQT